MRARRVEYRFSMHSMVRVDADVRLHLVLKLKYNESVLAFFWVALPLDVWPITTEQGTVVFLTASLTQWMSRRISQTYRNIVCWSYAQAFRDRLQRGVLPLQPVAQPQGGHRRHCKDGVDQLGARAQAGHRGAECCRRFCQDDERVQHRTKMGSGQATSSAAWWCAM